MCEGFVHFAIFIPKLLLLPLLMLPRFLALRRLDVYFAEHEWGVGFAALWPGAAEECDVHIDTLPGNHRNMLLPPSYVTVSSAIRPEASFAPGDPLTPQIRL